MEKKIPKRQCVGCGEMKDKRELIRVVKTTEGEIVLDFKGKTNGRGSYICKNEECLKKAIKSKGFERALQMSIPEEVSKRLIEEIAVEK